MRTFLSISLVNLFFLFGFFPSNLQNAYAEFKDFKQLRSNHFIIDYQKGVERSYSVNIKRKAEVFYRKITQEFRLVRDKLWVWDNRAKIFIAKDQKNYFQKFNCPKWSAACVDYRSKKIYTYPGQKYFISTLVHELTHIIFREYIKRQNVPLWLDEGMAMYTETKFSDSRYQDSSYQIKEKIKSNSFIPFQELVTVDARTLKEKPSSYVETFYLQSFSVINFLVKKYKKYRFSQFLWNFKNESDIKKSLFKTYYQLNNLKDLEKKWKNYYLK
ncbi:MAG: peptidase MA family metallohydrolase [Candidatus Omnitrophota bacterium]